MTATPQTPVLLVEDDENLGFVIKDTLLDAGYEVDLCNDGRKGHEAFLQRLSKGPEAGYKLCILDVMMPKKDGFELAEDIRKSDTDVPIVFLTAKGMAEDKITGLRLGADDYITKPFNIEELLLRIEAILKRTTRPAEAQEEQGQKDVFQLGNYTFNYLNYELHLNGQTKSLTKKEADLLRLLCIRQNEVLEREMALNIVWGSDDYFLGRSMDVFITKLRKHLKGDDRLKIENVHGVGFRLVVP